MHLYFSGNIRKKLHYDFDHHARGTVTIKSLTPKRFNSSLTNYGLDQDLDVIYETTTEFYSIRKRKLFQQSQFWVKAICNWCKLGEDFVYDEGNNSSGGLYLTFPSTTTNYVDFNTIIPTLHFYYTLYSAETSSYIPYKSWSTTLVEKVRIGGKTAPAGSSVTIIDEGYDDYVYVEYSYEDSPGWYATVYQWVKRSVLRSQDTPSGKGWDYKPSSCDCEYCDSCECQCECEGTCQCECECEGDENRIYCPAQTATKMNKDGYDNFYSANSIIAVPAGWYDVEGYVVEGIDPDTGEPIIGNYPVISVPGGYAGYITYY